MSIDIKSGMIFKTSVDEKFKDIFLNYIKNHDENNTKIKETLDGVSKTSYYYNLYDINLVNLYYQHLEIYVKDLIKSPFKMNCIWYQIYYKNSGSYHDYHTHDGEDCQISGIYYIKLKDQKISTEFLINQNPFQLEDIDEGDLILFDSKISHRSPPNNTNEDKIIVSFNIDCR